MTEHSRIYNVELIDGLTSLVYDGKLMIQPFVPKNKDDIKQWWHTLPSNKRAIWNVHISSNSNLWKLICMYGNPCIGYPLFFKCDELNLFEEMEIHIVKDITLSHPNNDIFCTMLLTRIFDNFYMLKIIDAWRKSKCLMK